MATILSSYRDHQESKEHGDSEEIRARREPSAPAEETVNPVPLETPAPPAPQARTDPPASAETLLLRWPVDSTRSPEELRWAPGPGLGGLRPRSELEVLGHQKMRLRVFQSPTVCSGTNGPTRTSGPQRITCKYLRHSVTSVKHHTHVDTTTPASAPSFQGHTQRPTKLT
ncbi:unnamed protein product [Arctogadus glacialis]